MKDKIKEIFERDGVVKINGLFTMDEVSKLRASGISSLAKSSECSRVRNQIINKNGVDYPALSFWPTVTTPFLNKIRTDKRIASIVGRILGENVKQLNNQFYFRMPGDGDEFAWHQDIFFRDNDEQFPGLVDGNKYLQTAIILDEVTEDSGAVEYVHGSHKDGRLPLLEHNEDAPKKLRHFDRSGVHGVKMTAMPGDFIMWSVMTVHGSEENKSDRSRMVYMNGFARADASKNFPYYLKNGEVIKDVDISMFPEATDYENTFRK